MSAVHPLLADVDWDREGDALLALFCSLLRFDTSNPPGHEAECVAFLADVLRDAGLEPQVLSPAPGRANLVTRLRGDGSRPPLLLNAHLDVVPAEADRWTRPPFAGEVHDGWVWGRGAVDMKHMAAMSAAVITLLARRGVPLRRDLIFAAVADEEAGCALGSRWLVDEHADQVRAEYALGEVGGFTLHLGGRPVYPIQVAEKGVCWLRARVEGTAGHGSIPRDDSAVVRLARFITQVGRRRLPLHVSPPVEAFVRGLAASQTQPARAVLPLLLQRRLSEVLVDRVIRDRSLARTLDALLRNTANPTVVRAGTKTNVVPGHATVELDGRIAVGSSEAEFLQELRAVAGPDIALEVLRSVPPYETSPDTELFAVLARVVADHHPGAVAVPSVIPGFTDAKSWARLGTKCYGFSPVRFAASAGVAFADLFHADDERVPVDGVRSGFKMLADAVCRFCCAERPSTGSSSDPRGR